MTTITIDDQLINEVIAVSHYQNSQEAVIKILADYVQHQKQQPTLFEQLRLTDDCADDELALLFTRDPDTARKPPCK
jgi:Arc/MetJ family transcription regulator